MKAQLVEEESKSLYLASLSPGECFVVRDYKTIFMKCISPPKITLSENKADTYNTYVVNLDGELITMPNDTVVTRVKQLNTVEFRKM